MFLPSVWNQSARRSMQDGFAQPDHPVTYFRAAKIPLEIVRARESPRARDPIGAAVLLDRGTGRETFGGRTEVSRLSIRHKCPPNKLDSRSLGNSDRRVWVAHSTYIARWNHVLALVLVDRVIWLTTRTLIEVLQEYPRPLLRNYSRDVPRTLRPLPDPRRQ